MAISTGTALALAAGATAASGIASRNAAKNAAQQQSNDLRAAQNLTREATNQARGDISRIFPVAQQNLLMGGQGAMDVFNQVTPQQMQVMQQGNMAAQQALLAGLPQMNNAILGLPVDYSGIQARQLQAPQFNFSMPAFNLGYNSPSQTQAQTAPANQPPPTQSEIQQAVAAVLSGMGQGGVSAGIGGTGQHNMGDGSSLFQRVR